MCVCVRAFLSLLCFFSACFFSIARNRAKGTSHGQKQSQRHSHSHRSKSESEEGEKSYWILSRVDCISKKKWQLRLDGLKEKRVKLTLTTSDKRLGSFENSKGDVSLCHLLCVLFVKTVWCHMWFLTGTQFEILNLESIGGIQPYAFIPKSNGAFLDGNPRFSQNFFFFIFFGRWMCGSGKEPSVIFLSSSMILIKFTRYLQTYGINYYGFLKAWTMMMSNLTSSGWFLCYEHAWPCK